MLRYILILVLLQDLLAHRFPNIHQHVCLRVTCATRLDHIREFILLFKLNFFNRITLLFKCHLCIMRSLGWLLYIRARE